MIVHDPKNKLRIDEIYLFVSQDEDGNEGIISFPSKIGQLPLIAADKARLDSLRPAAISMKKLTPKKIVLIKFTTREEIEIL